MEGPGKYDAIATVAREAAKARGIVLVIFGGERGHGLEVQGDVETLWAVPEILRETANAIEADLLRPDR